MVYSAQKIFIHGNQVKGISKSWAVINQTLNHNEDNHQTEADKVVQDLNQSFLGVDDGGPAGEHVGQHVFGDLWATDAQGVAGILHLAEALSQRVQLLGHLVRTRVPNVGETVMDLPQELTQLEGRIDIAVAHTADAHPHQLASEVSYAKQVVWGRHVEGQDLSSH